MSLLTIFQQYRLCVCKSLSVLCPYCQSLRPAIVSIVLHPRSHTGLIVQETFTLVYVYMITWCINIILYACSRFFLETIVYIHKSFSTRTMHLSNQLWWNSSILISETSLTLIYRGQFTRKASLSIRRHELFVNQIYVGTYAYDITWSGMCIRDILWHNIYRC